jgi:serine protease Do
MSVRALVTAVALVAVPATASAQIQSNTKVVAPFKAVVAKVNESTVRIRCKEKDAEKDCALGTVVFADGYILTKASELRGDITVRLNDGAEYEATVVGRHKDTDLALLHVDVKDLKPVAFADSGKVPTGSWLVAASEKSDPVGVGIVSVMTRKLTGPDAEAFNFNKGYLGVVLDTTDYKDADGKVTGARVLEVSSGSGAKKAGLKVKDVIVSVDGAKTPGRKALQEALDNRRPNEEVTLTYLREDDEKNMVEKTAKVKLGDRGGEKDRGELQNSFGSALSGRRTGFPAVLQTDMVVKPENCGGPVVDLDGKVLGIAIARAGRVETWVLPSENIRPLLNDLKAGKFAPAGTTTIQK